ncbi:hypothetical protein EYV94_24775 [Puteibacter caeruleilacunae]|nr:hypothetical protein EYV94_24775 [Puteibacter caeruleilacunae]
MKTLFKEEQKFTQWWWYYLIFIVIGIIPTVGIYKQLILGEKFGSNPISDVGLVIFSVLVYTIIVLYLMMKLTTTIDEDGIKMSFFPFVTKNIKWSEIKKVEIVDYGFVGGWGIQFWTSYGTVYNIKGKIGLAIELMNGKKFLIGTQKEAELRRILKKPAISKR